MAGNIDLHSTEVTKLVSALEEVTRATRRGVPRFIEPASGTLDRAKSARHHVIFGRRGSGKSSLLRKSEYDLSLKRVPVAYVDLERFKGNAYPDVLLMVLIDTLNSFKKWIEEAGTFGAKKVRFWGKLFGKNPSRPPLPKKERELLVTRLSKLIDDFKRLLHSQDDAPLESSITAGSKTQDTAGGTLGFVAPPFAGTMTDSASSERSEGIQLKETTKRSKVEFLNRITIDLQDVFSAIATAGAGSAFLIFDDLYHIKREDQASLIDYIHRIIKNTGVWMKIGTIRHRTEHYRHGNPPIGVKLGDDADDIDLDITLERYETAYGFLEKILGQLLLESGIEKHSLLLAETGLDRLVLASGGVARDFLTILRRAIDHARERGSDARGPKVGAEDVNRAAGDHNLSKRDELNLDANEDRERIVENLDRIKAFCSDESKSNCLLVDRDGSKSALFVLSELVDLKMLHIVNSRVTISDRQKESYIAYMLDLSQYSQDRKGRGIEMIEFWRKDQRDTLRRARLVFDLSKLTTTLSK